MFNDEQKNYKTDKGDQDPFYPLIGFLVEFLIFSVHQCHYYGESNNKEESKNGLTR